MMKNHSLNENQAPQIFVVENDSAFGHVLVKKLLKMGYQAKLYKEGANVLKDMEIKSPDLVLLNIQLPDIDSKQICLDIKSHPILNNVPVIMFVNLNSTSPKVLKGSKYQLSELFLVKSSWTLSALTSKINESLRARLFAMADLVD